MLKRVRLLRLSINEGVDRVRFPLGSRIGVRLELRDYMSKFDSLELDRPARLQHDIIFMPGLVFSF